MDFSKVCVLGMGYIGLPTASTLATQGMQVVGVDANQRVVRILRDGEIHIHEPGLRTLAQAAFKSGRLTIRDKPEEADAFIIAVQTPLRENNQANMGFVISAAQSIVPFLRNGNLVVLESTSPPRTTIDLVAPILEQSGLSTGKDYFLAYTPERVLPGQILRELIDNARVIGGYDRASAEAGRDLYVNFVRGEIYLTDATTAEMVKLMENTARDINIALANEFSRLAEHFGLSVWEALELANLHPRVNILRPGPGVGGHCISIDPYFLIQAAPDLSGLMQRAREVNDEQPAYVAAGIERELDGLSDRRIAALGLAYKADVDDLRNSPAMEVARLLADKGAKVSTFEPFMLEAAPQGCVPADSLADAVKDADALVLLVDHRQFREIDPLTVAGQMPGREAFDTRGIWSSSIWQKGGFQLHTLGVRSPDA